MTLVAVSLMSSFLLPSLAVGERTLGVTIVSPPPDKLAAAPILLLTFAGTRGLSLFEEPYCLAARCFLEQGHRVASFDLPGHGTRVNDFGEGIIGLRNAFVAGRNPFAMFVEDGKAVIDECIKRGWARPGRIMVAGTSRGGYCALRLLAEDERIAGGAGFAPVTDWRYLSEFAQDRERRDVAQLRLVRFVEGLVGKRVFLAIGGQDDRVSTASCRHLYRAVRRADIRAGYNESLVAFHITEDVGHTMGDVWYQRGAQFLLQYAAQCAD